MQRPGIIGLALLCAMFHCFGSLETAQSKLTMPSGAGYSSGEIINCTRQLAEKVRIPEYKLADLLVDLKIAMRHDTFKRAVENNPVTGILVYKGGEGGLFWKGLKADGLIAFKNGRKPAGLTVTSRSFGAQIGGSAVWGVGLIMGLKNESHFGGIYCGKVKSATAGTENTPGGSILTQAGSEGELSEHAIFLVTANSGLSAGVRNVKMNIIPEWRN